jgi:hypothetical protein
MGSCCLSFRDEVPERNSISTRITTLQEDIAYFLFGIFSVRLPVICGEKKQNALGRLLNRLFLHQPKAPLSGGSSDTLAVSNSSSSTAVDGSSTQDDGPGSALASTAFSPMSRFKAVIAVFMERTPFAIDDAGNSDDDNDLSMAHGEDDDRVMDEVSGFRNRGIFDDAQCTRWMPFWRHMILDFLKQTRRSQMVRYEFSCVYRNSLHSIALRSHSCRTSQVTRCFHLSNLALLLNFPCMCANNI